MTTVITSGLFGYRSIIETYPGDRAQVGIAAEIDGVIKRLPASLYGAVEAAANGKTPTDAQREQLGFLGVEMIDATNETRERTANKMLAESVPYETITAHLKRIPTTYRSNVPVKILTAFKAA